MVRGSSGQQKGWSGVVFGGEAEVVPTALVEQVAEEVVFVHALADDDDAAVPGVVQSRPQCSVEPVVHALAGGRGGCLFDLQGIVDSEDVAALAGGGAAHAGCQPRPAAVVLEPLLRVLV